MASLVTFLFKDRFSGFQLVYRFLNRIERRKYGLFIFSNIFFSVMDVIGIFLIGLVGTLSFSILTGADNSEMLSGFLQLFNVEYLERKMLILFLSLTALVFFILKSLLYLHQNYKLNLFLAEISIRLSKDLLKRVFLSRLQFIQTKSREEISFTLSEGVQYATIGILGSMAAFLTESVFIACIFLVLCLYNTNMLLALVAFGIVFFVPSQKYFSRQSKFYSNLRNEGLINDNVRVTDAVNLFREIVLTKKVDFFANKFEDGRKTSQRAYGILLWVQNLPKISIEIGTVLVIGLLGLIAILPGSASNAISFILVFTVAVSRIAPSILRIQQSIIGIVSNTVYAKQSLSLLNLIPRSDLVPKEVHPESNFLLEDGLEIELRNVDFAFSDSEEEILFHNLDLFIPRNSLVALVGPSGIGKSTFCDLITGFQKPQSGEISLNGMNVVDFLSSFSRFISYLPQKNYLISGTVSENVSLDGNFDSAQDDRVRAALVDSGMWEFLVSRGIGIHDEIQNLGVSFSGGQQQRIGIARALYFKSKLIILDEPTSSLDPDATSSFLKTVKEISKSCTVLIVSHQRECLSVATHIIDFSQKEIKLSFLG